MPAAGTSKFEVTDEIISEVETLASKGLTTAQIGDVLGVNERTVYRYKKNDSRFSQAIKEGQAKGIETISNALFKAGKDGNVTAMIFFLKNRAPAEWRDKQDLEHTGPGGGPIQLIKSDMTPQQAIDAYTDTLHDG